MFGRSWRHSVRASHSLTAAAARVRACWRGTGGGVSSVPGLANLLSSSTMTNRRPPSMNVGSLRPSDRPRNAHRQTVDVFTPIVLAAFESERRAVGASDSRDATDDIVGSALRLCEQLHSRAERTYRLHPLCHRSEQAHSSEFLLRPLLAGSVRWISGSNVRHIHPLRATPVAMVSRTLSTMVDRVTPASSRRWLPGRAAARRTPA